MALQYRVRVIDHWPDKETPPSQRCRSRFRTKWSGTKALLERELKHLNARDVIIGLDVVDKNIRLDGKLRESTRPATPRVILAFESSLGPLKYWCDRFLGWGGVKDWQENLRAIALGMEALRKIERYGIAKRGQQYAGFKALPGSGEMTTTMTALAAAEAIVDWADESFVNSIAICDDYDAFRTAYRVAARKIHPDVNGGDPHRFQVLQECRVILEAHHGQ